MASVARDYDLDPSQIYQWRKALKVSRLPSQEVATSPEFLPVQVWAAGCVSAWNIGSDAVWW